MSAAMKLSAIDLFREITGLFDGCGVSDPTADELNDFIMKCLLWVEARDPQAALVLARRYDLDGNGGGTYGEIGKTLSRHLGGTGVSASRTRAMVGSAIYDLRRAYADFKINPVNIAARRRAREKPPEMLHSCQGALGECATRPDRSLWVGAVQVVACPYCGKSTKRRVK
jgi:hypothetical protein